MNNSSDKAAIRFPECPRCRQKIYRCIRYLPILNRVYHFIAQVKRKILGRLSETEINHEQQRLLVDYSNMKNNLQEITLDRSTDELFSGLFDEHNTLTEHVLNTIANLIVFLTEIDQLVFKGRRKLCEKIFQEQVRFPLGHLQTYLCTQRYSRNFAEQQLLDVQSELKRIGRVIIFETVVAELTQTLKTHEQEMFDSMQHLIKKSGPFTDSDRQAFDDLAKTFRDVVNLPGLGITEHERKDIVSALNISKGHWYVCPNGHPYLITEVRSL